MFPSGELSKKHEEKARVLRNSGLRTFFSARENFSESRHTDKDTFDMVRLSSVRNWMPTDVGCFLLVVVVTSIWWYHHWQGMYQHYTRHFTLPPLHQHWS